MKPFSCFHRRPQSAPFDKTRMSTGNGRSRRFEICATACSVAIFAVTIAGLLLGGCLLKPVTVSTRRFHLVPIPPSERPSRVEQQLSVGVSSVKMPAYLLKNSIVLRRHPSEIEYLEDTLWGERLDHSFQQTLAANLSTLLASDRVYLSAWERDQVSLRVSVNLEQFDVDTEGHSTLIAWWRLTASPSDKLLKSGQTRLSRTGPAPHGDPQVIVTNLSALTAEFSRELAQAIHRSNESSP